MTRFRDVVDWVEGRLDAAAAARVAQDVSEDPELAAAAAFVRRFRDAAATLEAPPASVREDLRRRFPVLRPAPPSLLDRVRATVAFDSALPGLAGVRSGGGSLERHLVLESPSVDVAVDVHTHDAVRGVEGQVLPRQGTASAAVRLLDAEGREAAAATTDLHGTFALPPVPPGAYVLEVTSTGPVVEAALDLD